MKQTKYRFILTAFAAVVLLATGCSKEPQDDGGSSATGKMVSVTLPIGFGDATTADTQTTAKGVADAVNTAPAPTASRAAAAKSHEEGFSVSFGEPTIAATAANAPTTRTVAQALTDVWVLQFDNTGKNVVTTNTGTLAAGAHLTARALQVGDGYTICVVANGPASGLTTSNPATLADFEAKMLYTDVVTDATKLPLSGKLTGVSVINLGGGNGKLKLMDASPLKLILTRIHAEVTLVVDFAVSGYKLTSAQLYNVPKGATYGWNSATTTFPANTVAANFGYTDTDTDAAGMASFTPTTSGSKTTYKWFIGDNRRGEVAGLTAQFDRHSANAPACSAFARVTLTNSTTNSKKIYYDIYLGSGTLTNFDVKRNHTYTQTATIKGTADFQEALVDVDYRVSGTGFPLVHIFLTDSKAHSPIVISPKSTESSTMIWGPSTSIPGAQDIFNGKANTDAIMATNATDYLAAKHCRKQGANYYLPSQAELMLMWIYNDAIPSTDRPASSYLWSSTELSTSNAWYVYFSGGNTSDAGKNGDYYVRCVRGL